MHVLDLLCIAFSFPYLLFYELLLLSHSHFFLYNCFFSLKFLISFFSITLLLPLISFSEFGNLDTNMSNHQFMF
jgi:hypothetical protein